MCCNTTRSRESTRRRTTPFPTGLSPPTVVSEGSMVVAFTIGVHDTPGISRIDPPTGDTDVLVRGNVNFRLVELARMDIRVMHRSTSRAVRRSIGPRNGVSEWELAAWYTSHVRGYMKGREVRVEPVLLVTERILPGTSGMH